MASFGTAYGLCTLGDQKEFLHVEPDEEDSAVVTLGKNIIIRYRLFDQKQLNSWSSIAKISSKVTYSSEKSEYYAIFDQIIVKRWTKNDTNLEKVTKTRLKEAGYAILFCDEPVVLFRSGACCSLSYCESRDYEERRGFEKLQGFIPEHGDIVAAKITKFGNTKLLVIVAEVTVRNTFCYTLKVDEESHVVLDSYQKVLLQRPGQRLLGSCFITREGRENLVTLWTDGFVYIMALPGPNQEIGRFVGTVRCLAITSFVSICPVGEHHVAIYGSNVAEEGAILAIYNLDFGMVQTSTTFKFLQKPAVVWAVHNKLLVCVGQRLVCVPLTLEVRNLSALIGTRTLVGNDQSTSDVQSVVSTAGWDENVNEGEDKVEAPEKLRESMRALTSQGFSEAGICETIITNLINEKDITSLIWCLENFIDISEPLCVRLVNFALTAPDAIFTGVPKSLRKKPEVEGVALRITGSVGPRTENPIKSQERTDFLLKILRVPVTGSDLTDALRSELNYEDCFPLFRFLSYSLSCATFLTVTGVLTWVSSSIDAFYQQLVLSGNPDLLLSIVDFRDIVIEHIDVINNLMETITLMKRINGRKGIKRKQKLVTLYRVIKLQLYK